MLKTLFWKLCYNYLATQCDRPEITFMNYGFVYTNPSLAPQLRAKDEKDRLCIQLYHRVLTDSNIADKTVLEIGSGRGGGAHYMASYMQPRLVLGIDLSAAAIAFCRTRYQDQCAALSFKEGDAEHLPIPDSSIDVAVNIESSHCYPSRQRFFAEVFRILRPGGVFAWADFVQPGQEQYCALAERTGFGLEEAEDITTQVVLALDQLSSRASTIGQFFPRLLRRPFEVFAGKPGTRLYERLRTRELIYLRLKLRKPF